MSLEETLETEDKTSPSYGLLQRATQRFRAFETSLHPIYDALDYVGEIGNIDEIRAAAKIRRQMEQFEPSVTMIGQIKSGKTSLVNAMIGMPDLLPADVNPWTSVVTSVHTIPWVTTPPTKAVFRFFNNDEWHRLVKGGGRIGELADRAGAADELATILQQAEAMREKARARLGRKFELLLGEERNYGYFDKDLIESYVCVGNESDAPRGLSKSKGYFADITRSADLYMQQEALPTKLCIRDTPGVNDTFMVREQITIKAIRDSRICMVVLSAHQALSSTDLALIRLISNVKSNDVIIFVNRIDELCDPARDVSMIRDSIKATLAEHNGPEDAHLVFGSALWANCAVANTISGLPQDSIDALYNWAEACPVPLTDDRDPHELLWHLSGVPALYDAVAQRVAEGAGREMAKRHASSAANLLGKIRVNDNLAAKSGVGKLSLRLSTDELTGQLEQIKQDAVARFENDFAGHLRSFHSRVDRSHDSFLTRATEDLAKHLEAYGEDEPWSYDPSGLRILLQSNYRIFGIKAQTAQQDAAKAAVSDLKSLCTRALGLEPELFAPQIPPASFVPPPVSIGQSIALDLRGSWWKGWWHRRQSYISQAQRFQSLVRKETQQLVGDLKDEQAALVYDAMRSLLDDFLAEQLDNIKSICGTGGPVSLDQVLGVDELKAREDGIARAFAKLEQVTHD
jgi:signal recognition particle receptor subunit beta